MGDEIRPFYKRNCFKTSILLQTTTSTLTLDRRWDRWPDFGKLDWHMKNSAHYSSTFSISTCLCDDKTCTFFLPFCVVLSVSFGLFSLSSDIVLIFCNQRNCMPYTCTLITCNSFFFPKVYSCCGKFCRLGSSNKHKCVLSTLFLFIILSVVKLSDV